MKKDRRLSAIMFTDIVGSTSMMAKDEARAVASVSRHKKVVEQCAQNHDGEIMNFYGDGSLTIFPSATSALLCAIEIQENMKIAPEIPLRIGIHIGEILIEEGEIFGDGVNVASRIESLGQSGTILFSEEVHFKIRNNPQFQSTSIGQFEFKNVEEPMKVFALSNPGFPVPKAGTITGKLKSERTEHSGQPTYFKKILQTIGLFKTSKSDTDEIDELSIAVLPFEKHGKFESNDIYADSISDEIRTQLLSIKDLKVISRNSSLQFKNKNILLKKVSKDLGVTYVLEGRVLSQSNQLTLQMDLSNAKTDSLIWSPSPMHITDENKLSVQNEIAIKIANELNLTLTEKEENQLKTKATSNAEAYLEFQNGQELLHRGYGFIAELEQAELHFKRAVSIDPLFVKAWVGLAETYLDYIFWGRAAPKAMLEKAFEPCMKAMQLAPESGDAWGSLGALYFYRGEKTKAKAHLLKAIELSPGYVEAYAKLGWISSKEKSLEDALHYFIQARSLDPLSTKYIGDIGQVYYEQGLYDQGIEFTEIGLKNHPGDSWLLWIMGLLYLGKEDFEMAIHYFSSRPTGQNNWLLSYALGKAGRNEEAEKILLHTIEKRMAEFVPAQMIAVMYLGVRNYEEALHWLEKDVLEGSMSLYFLTLDSPNFFKDLEGYPRFQLLKAAQKSQVI